MYQRVKIHFIVFILISSFGLLLLGSCSGPRKCNGGKAQHTEMGTM